MRGNIEKQLISKSCRSKLGEWNCMCVCVCVHGGYGVGRKYFYDRFCTNFIVTMEISVSFSPIACVFFFLPPTGANLIFQLSFALFHSNLSSSHACASLLLPFFFFFAFLPNAKWTGGINFPWGTGGRQKETFCHLCFHLRTSGPRSSPRGQQSH